MSLTRMVGHLRAPAGSDRRLLLADKESGLGEQIIELMKTMNHEVGTTFIFSTHDPSIVGIADHVIRLKDGLITENVRTTEGVRA